MCILIYFVNVLTLQLSLGTRGPPACEKVCVQYLMLYRWCTCVVHAGTICLLLLLLLPALCVYPCFPRKRESHTRTERKWERAADRAALQLLFSSLCVIFYRLTLQTVPVRRGQSLVWCQNDDDQPRSIAFDAPETCSYTNGGKRLNFYNKILL